MHTAVLTLLLLVQPSYQQPGYQQQEQRPDGQTETPRAQTDQSTFSVSEEGTSYRSRWRAYWGPEPQSCYAPRFGCYPGNNRHMHRYPAFHGFYYRRPYNYREQFDYPWHAGLHEPTSLFSYNVTSESTEDLMAPSSAQRDEPPVGRRTSMKSIRLKQPKLAPLDDYEVRVRR